MLTEGHKGHEDRFRRVSLPSLRSSVRFGRAVDKETGWKLSYSVQRSEPSSLFYSVLRSLRVLRAMSPLQRASTPDSVTKRQAGSLSYSDVPSSACFNA